MSRLFFKVPSITQNQLFRFNSNLLLAADIFHCATALGLTKLMWVNILSSLNQKDECLNRKMAFRTKLRVQNCVKLFCYLKLMQCMNTKQRFDNVIHTIG